MNTAKFLKNVRPLFIIMSKRIKKQCEKCPYSEFFLSVFSHICAELSCLIHVLFSVCLTVSPSDSIHLNISSNRPIDFFGA